ncbi:MBL fold metallo-hydrolase [Vallitalea longa]|uniref:MBL fold metallo-hydrolase n=1 Tax=Vallitalea longa TaxID=2936439 RepID=A0A9W5YCY1_9FIRM|nr:MBL fold metallo-hydrolase [Vallitalea longa]GKX31780.1 MBL fold metallo-hydrolase [Vallitalea longa]
MVHTKVGNRGILFTFDELNKPPYDCVTNVYVIIGVDNYFICDTYLGKYYMRKIKKFLEDNYGSKDCIVFNSHSHWDHIWGNSEFSNDMIIAHEKCRDYISINGKQELEENISFTKENIEIVLPNITFSSSITFHEEGLKFFHSPGHSEDSSSCYDMIDNTLFVGDNVDDPIPSSMDSNDLDKYLDTLNHYLTYQAHRVVQSHGKVIDENVIRSNIDYINKLKNNEFMEFQSEEVIKKHKDNLKFLNID